MYMDQSDYTLRGFYGVKTMDEYKKQPSLREERRLRKEAERKQRERRATLATVPESAGDSSGVRSVDGREVAKVSSVEGNSAPPPEDSSENTKESKMRKLSRVLSGGRRYSVV